MARYCIGDVHGMDAALDRLLDLVAADAERRPGPRALVLVGDYVDRGPGSRRALDMVLALPRRLPGFGIVALGGNHEEAMLAVLDGDVDMARGWLPERHGAGGGYATLRAYGVRDPERLALDDVPRALRDAVDPAHVEFMRGLPRGHDDGTYFFAHAGVRPGVPLDRQDPHDLAWIRDEFMESDADHGRIVVHGHTPRRGGEKLRNRVNVDAGAGYGLPLACFVLPDAYEPHRVATLAVPVEGPMTWIDPPKGAWPSAA